VAAGEPQPLARRDGQQVRHVAPPRSADRGEGDRSVGGRQDYGLRAAAGMARTPLGRLDPPGGGNSSARVVTPGFVAARRLLLRTLLTALPVGQPGRELLGLR